MKKAAAYWLAAWAGGTLGHRMTDPACAWHVRPRGRLSSWWFNRGRGKYCPVCMARLRRLNEGQP